MSKTVEEKESEVLKFIDLINITDITNEIIEKILPEIQELLTT